MSAFRNPISVFLVALGAVISPHVLADVITPLASYEPSETGLTVTANPGDLGLAVSIVQGGVGGAPPATDGEYLLKIVVSGEADHKIEFRHAWSSSTYDLNGRDELLADVLIASPELLPGVMGIWSQNWNPPNVWQPATGLPTQLGVWVTVSFDVSQRSQTGLSEIEAFIFQQMAGTTGVGYVDNLRLRTAVGPSPPTGVAANGFEGRNGIAWKPLEVGGLEGYNVLRSDSPSGPFVKLNSAPVIDAVYYDPTTALSPFFYYYVTAVADGLESGPSEIVSTLWDGWTDEALLDWVQSTTFSYFWDYGHPYSGLAREGLTHAGDVCALGGTGMGLMAIVVGSERGFVTRAAAADRVLQILTFLDDDTTRYHGAWSHWINGSNGATIPFSTYDNGGDLVETSYLCQGLLTARQYFDDPSDAVEAEIRTRATSMWEGVEWDWYERFPGSGVLYWHWSPNYAWTMNMQIRGYMEAMITYLLAIASPTHPIPPSSYYNGWAGLSSYTNGQTYYDYHLWVGPSYGGPLFFTHYSHLGFDPRYKRDAFCNYFENSRNIALIHQAYSIDNPHGYADYSRWLWGLTASASPPPWYYTAHSPTNDNGTIAPTAALSSMPFTPDESLAALRYMLDNYTPALTGPYGLYDAFNPDLGWYSDTHLAIDQGPIVVMIENYRTGLCWRLFMSNPEIQAMMMAVGIDYEVDYDLDGDVDAADMSVFTDCLSGPDDMTPPPGVTQPQFNDADLDNDGDVDLHDTAVLQRLVNAP